MGVAQRLYEGVDVGAEGTVGLITYMRTDSPRVAPEAIAGAREWIGKQLGAKYLPATAERVQGQEGRAGRARSDSPDGRVADAGVDCALFDRGAAEALPADLAAVCGVADDAGGLRRDHGEDCGGESAKTGKTYDFRVSGSVVRFDGFLKVYEVCEEKKDEDDESSATSCPTWTA